MIADVMEEETFTKGDVIFRQGDYDSKFYIVKEGTATCLRHEKDFARLGAGDYFCESALITRKLKQATVIADTEILKCLTIERKIFNRVIGSLKDILKRDIKAYNRFQASII